VLEDRKGEHVLAKRADGRVHEHQSGHLTPAVGSEPQREGATHGESAHHDLVAVGPELLERPLHLAVPVGVGRAVQLLPGGAVAREPGYGDAEAVAREVLAPGTHRSRGAGEPLGEQNADPLPVGIGHGVGVVRLRSGVDGHGELLGVRGGCRVGVQ
jgi:hypothetical protein